MNGAAVTDRKCGVIHEWFLRRLVPEYTVGKFEFTDEHTVTVTLVAKPIDLISIDITLGDPNA